MAKTTDFLELTGSQTARALLNRRIYRVTCCRRLMYQESVVATMPKHEKDCGTSDIVLRCPHCKKSIMIECLTVARPTEEMWERMCDYESVR